MEVKQNLRLSKTTFVTSDHLMVVDYWSCRYNSWRWSCRIASGAPLHGRKARGVAARAEVVDEPGQSWLPWLSGAREPTGARDQAVAPLSAESRPPGDTAGICIGEFERAAGTLARDCG